MSVSNIEINFSSNGSPHQATVTEILGDISCGGPHKVSIKSSGFGSPTKIDNPEINNLLKNFVLESQSTSVDARTKKREYKYIDRISEILERYVVLVRGLTAPPITKTFPNEVSFLNNPSENNGLLKFEGPVFTSSELPDKAFGPALAGYTPSNPSPYRPKAMLMTDGSYSSPSISTFGNILILGSTYSVISQQIQNEKSFQVFNARKEESIAALSLDSKFSKSQVIYDNSTPPKAIGFIDPKKGQRFDPTKATIKYGYTAREFFSALQKVGITLFDKTISFGSLLLKEDNLFDTSGTLRDCLSAITSYYGYYWYVDLSAGGGGISLLTSSWVLSQKVKDPSLDKNLEDSVLSYSFSEGGRSPYVVSSFVGTTSPDDNNPNKQTFQVEETPIHKEFKRVDCMDLINLNASTSCSEKTLQGFFTYFFSEASENQEIFDRLFFLAEHFYTGFDAGKLYGYNVSEKGKEKRITEVLSKDSLDFALYDKSIYYFKRSDDVVLLSQNGNSKDGGSGIANELILPSPSQSSVFYTLCKAYYQYFGSIFISNGYSEQFTERATFSGGEISISKAYKSSTSLEEIEELVDFVNLLKALGVKVPTLESLARNAGVKLGLGARDGVTKYHYIATMPKGKILGAKKGTKSAAFSADEFKFLTTDVIVGASLWQQSSQKVKIMLKNGNVKKKLTNLFSTSISRFKKAADNLEARILVPMTRIDNGPDGTEGEGEKERLPYENTFFKIVPPAPLNNNQQNLRMCKAELKSFSGSVQDMKNLCAANPLRVIGSQIDLNSVSKTYAGLNAVTPTILTDSISIQIGSDGITTTITESNKNIMPPDQSIILNEGNAAVAYNFKQALSAGAKNFFKIH